MRRFKTLLMMAVVVSICGVMVSGCASNRRGNRVDNRTDNREDRRD
jgi:outer membrane murein-binding lipoprotein Lpp